MTREDALNKTIGILTYHQVNFCKSKEAVASMNEIIEALEKIDQEPCEDCISRQAVLDIVEREQFKGDALHGIEKLPSVTPQPKVGRWKRISMDKYSEHANYWYRCDRCGKDNLGNTNYCPNCGQPKIQEVEE